MNLSKELSTLQVVDIVKVHLQVRYNLEYGSVGKLSYRAWGPYRIMNNLGHNYFEVKNLLDDTATIQKYKTH